MPLTTEPSLLKEMFRPRAMESSLPLNHFDTMADWPTLMDSPPSLQYITKISKIPKDDTTSNHNA